MTSWARHLGRADLEVSCIDGHAHRVRFERGDVVLLDHDVPAERALQSLGGEEPACLSILRAWRETTLETVTVPETMRSRMRAHGKVPAWVVSLPPELETIRRKTLVVHAERAWGRGTAPVAGGYLERETQRIATPALHRWLVVSGEAALSPLTVSYNVFPPPGEPSVETWFQDGSRVVGVWVSREWWRVVGIAGRTLVDGGRGFVLDAGRDRWLVARWRNGKPVIGEEAPQRAR